MSCADDLFTLASAIVIEEEGVFSDGQWGKAIC